MANLSLRGVDEPTLARIRISAIRRKVSVNRLIVDSLRQLFRADGVTYDDLDDLAGKWTRAEAAAFSAAIAPLSEIEPGLWVAEKRSPYRAATRKNASATTVKPAKGPRR